MGRIRLTKKEKDWLWDEIDREIAISLIESEIIITAN